MKKTNYGVAFKADGELFVQKESTYEEARRRANMFDGIVITEVAHDEYYAENTTELGYKVDDYNEEHAWGKLLEYKI